MRPLWAVLLLPACVDTSPDRVKLTGDVPTVALSVQTELLAALLSGDFSLRLERGDLSESGATVTESPVFALLAANGAELLRLDALPTPPPPWSVSPDTTLSVSYALTDQNLIDEATATTACEGGVTVRGLVEPDDADAFTVQSAPVTPSGCN